MVTDGSYDRPKLCLDRPHQRPSILDVSDQCPYGDFTIGRYAWLLEDAKLTTERCPACGGDGIDPLDEDDGQPSGMDLSGNLIYRRSPYPCPTCDGKGLCPPIPAKGRQGIWNWEPA